MHAELLTALRSLPNGGTIDDVLRAVANRETRAALTTHDLVLWAQDAHRQGLIHTRNAGGYFESNLTPRGFPVKCEPICPACHGEGECAFTYESGREECDYCPCRAGRRLRAWHFARAEERATHDEGDERTRAELKRKFPSH